MANCPIKNFLLAVLTSALWPLTAHAEHVPNDLAQDLDPDWIACLIVVDDATPDFLESLQSTCLARTGDFCRVDDETAIPSEVIGCLNYEARQAIGYLDLATKALPARTEKKGFFGHNYQRRREELFRHVDVFNSTDGPHTIAEAVDRVVGIASDLHMLFWLARETGTPLDNFAPAYEEDH